MAARTVDGPAANFLTIEELAAEVGMSAATIKELIDRGQLPGPMLPSKGNQPNRWSWKQAVFINLRTELLPFMVQKGEKSE